MQKVEVKINKLGPIQNSTLTFSNLMIFSGESGIGKSYASSLAHYLYVLLSSGKRVAPFIINHINPANTLEQIKTAKEQTLLHSFKIKDLAQWMNTDSLNYVRYLIGNDDLEGDISFNLHRDETIEFHVNQVMEGLKDQEEVSYELRCGSFHYSITSNNPTEEMLIRALSALLIAYLNRLLSPDRILFFDVFLMPPSRGALLDITNLTTLASKADNQMLFRAGMYTEFLRNYEEIFSASLNKSAPAKSLDKLGNILRKLNKGIIKQSNTGLSYEMEDGKNIPLSSAASSIKELAPLSLYLSKRVLNGASSIWFEEPEAHLHPSKQVVMADLIGYVIHGGCHMQITTHSDYLLQRITNLLRLFELMQREETRARKILEKYQIDEDCLINPEHIKTYYLKQDETGITTIIDNSIEYGIRFDSFENTINIDASLTNDILYDDQNFSI